MYQWFPSLSFLPWIYCQSLSIKPKQTDRSWSWNPNPKHQASSYPGTLPWVLLKLYLKGECITVIWVRELQALNCIGSQKPKSGSYPEPHEYYPHPNPFKFHSNAILPSLPSSIQMTSSTRGFVSHLSHACYMSHPSHLSFNDTKNTWWIIQIMKPS
jgi:hypothetical protein